MGQILNRYIENHGFFSKHPKDAAVILQEKKQRRQLRKNILSCHDASHSLHFSERKHQKLPKLLDEERGQSL